MIHDATVLHDFGVYREGIGRTRVASVYDLAGKPVVTTEELWQVIVTCLLLAHRDDPVFAANIERLGFRIEWEETAQQDLEERDE